VTTITLEARWVNNGIILAAGAGGHLLLGS